MSNISGYCDSRFEPVREAFMENFQTRDELGAGFSVMLEGEYVVDLWGGYLNAEKSRDWNEDSLCAVWSFGKAVSALCILQCVEKGLLELDAPVANYWPEFAANGKETITLRQVLSHQAGLPAFREIKDDYIWMDRAGFAAILAEQKAWWKAGERHGYHVHTFATILAEILLRVTGISLTEYCNTQIASPLGVEFYFANEASVDERIADTIWPGLEKSGRINKLPDGVDATTADEDWLRRYLSYMPVPGFDKERGINSRAWRGAEFPSTASHSNARSVAKIFGVLANGGAYVNEAGDRAVLLQPETIEQAYQIESDGIDATLEKPSRFGLGFMLTSPTRPWGPNPNCFGHYGNNGLLCFADPAEKLGFAYTMNLQGRAWRDPRNIALVDAVYACLE